MLAPGAEDDGFVAGLEAECLDSRLSQRATLRTEIGANVPPTIRLADLGQVDVLILHQDAGVVRLLSKRHQGVIAGVAHHRDAVRLRRDRFTQLIRHLVHVPT